MAASSTTSSVYRTDPGYLVVCNAANRDVVVRHLTARWRAATSTPPSTTGPSGPRCVALAGPAGGRDLAPLTDVDLEALGYYRAARAGPADIECLVARTGYTGEDGFELFVDAGGRGRCGTGCSRRAAARAVPCGLGARDTLRLEAGMPLYGHELDETIDPFEADLGWVGEARQGRFRRARGPAQVKQAGLRRKLSAWSCASNAIARAAATRSRREAGAGRPGDERHASPTLGETVGLGYVPAELAARRQRVRVVRARAPSRAEQRNAPFFKRPSVSEKGRP